MLFPLLSIAVFSLQRSGLFTLCWASEKNTFYLIFAVTAGLVERQPLSQLFFFVFTSGLSRAWMD
jgi:hypothetical protein